MRLGNVDQYSQKERFCNTPSPELKFGIWVNPFDVAADRMQRIQALALAKESGIDAERDNKLMNCEQ